MNDFQEGEWRLDTSQAYVDEIIVALEYLAAGHLDPEDLITRELTLDTLVTDGFEELEANASGHIKILVRIGAPLEEES